MCKLNYVIAVFLLLIGVSNAYAQETLNDDLSYHSQSYDVPRFAAKYLDDPLVFDGRAVSYYLAGSNDKGVLSLFVQANSPKSFSSQVSPQDLNNIEPAAGIRLKFKLGK